MKPVKQLLLAALMTASSASFATSLLGASVTYNGHSYTLMTADTWTNSEAFAQSLGGHLVAVNSADEQAFLTSTFGSDKALWIGLARTYPHSPVFAWSNGDAVTYTHWAGGEPNDFGYGEEYTHTYAGWGGWNDLDNTSGYAGPKYGVLEIASVSEPSLLFMALSGLGLLGFMRRRSQ